MNHYEPPKTNPSANPHVANALNVEITERIYFAAKLQNRIRWVIVFLFSIGGFFMSDDTIGKDIAFPLALGVGVTIYFVLSKFLPIANLTSTTKFKKFGDKMKMDKMNQKLGLGDYADKDK